MPDGMAPLVGILANTEFIDGVSHHAVRDVYVRAVTGTARCAAVILPAGPVAASVVASLDGVVLTGHGSDVQPARYGGPADTGRRADGGGVDPARDEAALAVVKCAVTNGVPLFGVCRGLQELNVAYGGTLRDLSPVPPGIAGHREDLSLPRDEQYLPSHPVTITPGGVLHSVLGCQNAQVNSLHREGIDRLGDGLRAEATAPDGTVEAVSVVGACAFALGVQWHPEWYAATEPVSRRLFEAFGDACRTTRDQALESRVR